MKIVFIKFDQHFSIFAVFKGTLWNSRVNKFYDFPEALRLPALQIVSVPTC